MIPAIPGQYWGYRQILNRIGYRNGGYSTFLKLADTQGSPVYQLPRRRQMVWCTNDQLLELWTIDLVERSRKRLREQIQRPGHWYADRRGGAD